MKDIKKALEKADADVVGSNVINGKDTEIDLETEKLVLTSEEIIATKKIKEGYRLLEDKDITLVLDTKLTPELKAEGSIRDLVRHIQNMRKDADFEVSDHINIIYDTQSEFLINAITKFSNYITQETLCDNLKKNTVKQEKNKKELKIAGEKITLGLTVIK